MTSVRTTIDQARQRRRNGERGAVLVETVLATPIFLLVVFAIIEYGLVFRDYTTVNAATTDAARAISIAGDAIDADHRTLVVFADSATALPGSVVQSIIVFDAAGPDDDVPPACLSGPVSGVCNVYLPTDHALDVAEFGCLTGKDLDRYYCPTTRNVTQVGADFVGIHVVAERRMLTGFFGSTTDVSATEVMRMEPQER